jgi:light-regulated signal transduction histidine kinase (bacteriophytochrome)
MRVDSNEPDRAAVSLDEVFQEVKQDLSAALERTQAEISCEQLPIVQGDRHLLRILLQNLIERNQVCRPRGEALRASERTWSGR